MPSKTSCTGHLNSVIPFCYIPFKLSSCLKSIFLKSDAFLYLKSFHIKGVNIYNFIRFYIAMALYETAPVYSYWYVTKLVSCFVTLLCFSLNQLLLD